MPSSDSFMRQLSSRKGVCRKSTSRRWGGGGVNQMEELRNMYGGENGNMFMRKKRVMVIVDQSSHSKHAMMWALTHVANKADRLTLLHILPSSDEMESSQDFSTSHHLATSLASLCRACKPEVHVEALVIQGSKMATVINQVKKLDVSVLVLGQKKPSAFLSCMLMKSSSEEFVEQCIDNLECLTIGVRKQSRGMGGYLISTRWHKNFWLLA